MEHVLFVQKVKKEKKEEYIKYHKECWPELLNAIKKSGIEREIIWIFEEQILVYLMAEDIDDAMDQLSKTEVFKKWTKLMAQVLDEMQDYSAKGKIVKLEEVFHLERQLSTAAASDLL
jgi:L-rhamnose mutarotase